MADELERWIRAVPDFPRPGILFRDITPLLGEPAALRSVITRLAATSPTPRTVVGIESRGFIFGAGLALHWGTRFVPARKQGKLPGPIVREAYSLEYGENVLELQTDALSAGEDVLIVDDLLATGGTAAATARLVERLGARVAAVRFVIELLGLGGREALAGRDVESVVRLEA